MLANGPTGGLAGAGQPPKDEWHRLLREETNPAGAAVDAHAAAGMGVTQAPVAPSQKAKAEAEAALAAAENGEGDGGDGGDGGEGGDGDGGRGGRGGRGKKAATKADEADFFQGVYDALQLPSLRKPALAALAMLSLKWEFHRVAFLRDGRIVQAVIQIARDNTGVQKHPGGGGGRFAGAAAAAPATDDAELARLASSVLANLSAARELRIAARHALPRPHGVTTTADAADVAALVSALAAPSVDTVRVAATALANLASSAANRDKIATRHCAAQLLALAQIEVVPVARAALRCVCNVALHTATKEELLAEGALQLLLQFFGETLSVERGSPRMRPFHLARQLHTRRLALRAMANLCEGHLAVQATVVAHGALAALVGPLKRHNAAVTLRIDRAEAAAAMAAAEAAAAPGAAYAKTPSRGGGAKARSTANGGGTGAAAESGGGGDDGGSGGGGGGGAQAEIDPAILDAPSRQHLLRCLANLSLNEAGHSALVASGLMSEMPLAATRGGIVERCHCALLWANLSPNAETHAHVAHYSILDVAFQLLRDVETFDGVGGSELGGKEGGGGDGGGGDGGGADDKKKKKKSASGGLGGAATAGAKSATAAAAPPPSAAAAAALMGVDDVGSVGGSDEASKAEARRWDQDEEEGEDAGAVPSLSESKASLKLLLLQLIAELSAAEHTHEALVEAKVVPALLPVAESAETPHEQRMEAVVALSNLAENPATHDKAFGGEAGAQAFALFVTLLKSEVPELQREGFRALSCLALAQATLASMIVGGMARRRASHDLFALRGRWQHGAPGEREAE